MQIDWTTFLLEILNFLVLVWLLKRFFYKPVLAVLDKRRATIEAETSEAARLKEEADALVSQYQARMRDWEQEREKLRHDLDGEIASEREKRMAALKKSLSEEADAARVRETKTRTDREASIAASARGEAFSAVGALLTRLASPCLTSTIVAVFLEDLASLGEAERRELEQAVAHLAPEHKVEVASAHPLSTAEQASVATALGKAVGHEVNTSFKLEPDLLAGMQVSAGECLLSADLASELAFFRERPDNG